MARWAGFSYDRSSVLLKAFTLLGVASFGIMLFIRSPQAKRVGWIATGSLMLLGLLAVQLLRTLEHFPLRLHRILPRRSSWRIRLA